MNERMRILSLMFTSALGLASASAADIYRAPEGAGGYKDGPAYFGVNWSGLYVGANGGYGWKSGSDTWTAIAGGQPFGRGPGTEPSGGFFGGQIGYNWQRDRLVLGIESDFQGADISADNGATAPFTAVFKTNIDWFGSVRGRIGYALDRTLIYVTGGFAYGNVANKITTLAGETTFKRDETETGFVVGGGAEYKGHLEQWRFRPEVGRLTG